MEEGIGGRERELPGEGEQERERDHRLLRRTRENGRRKEEVIIMAPKIRHCACRIIPLRSAQLAALTPSPLGPPPLIVRSSRSSPQAKEREESGLKAVRRLG